MPHAGMAPRFGRAPGESGSEAMPALAGRIAGALPACGVPEYADAWQDGLDLLATLAGVKPACLLVGPSDGTGSTAAFAAIAAERGFAVLRAPPLGRSGTATPAWLVAAVRASAAHTWLVPASGREALAAVLERGEASAPQEAALLGYPACCVQAHHDAADARDAAWIDLARRAFGDDPERMARMLRAGVDPMPVHGADRMRWASLLAIDPEPFTSINRCARCSSAGASSPAGRIGARFRALAASSGYPMPDGWCLPR